MKPSVAHNLNRQSRHDEAEKMAREVLSMLQYYTMYAGRNVEIVECLKVIARRQSIQGKTSGAESPL